MGNRPGAVVGCVGVSNPYDALWGVLSHSDGLLLIDWQDGSRRESTYFPVAQASRYERMLKHHVTEGNDPRVGLVPRRGKSYDNIGQSCVVWASVENPTSLRGLAAFRPKPTLTFKTGRMMRCLWWLDKPLPMVADPSQDFLTRANRRLAFALKANSRCADPSWLMPMGELIDGDPDRVYAARDIVGRLRDAPARRRLVSVAA